MDLQGISVTRLAQRVGVGRVHMSNILRGIYSPSVPVLAKMKRIMMSKKP